MNNLIQKCDWEITTGCNLNCMHCLINHRPKRELTTKECFVVIDMLKRLGCDQINFTGGEALVKKDFLKILTYSHRRGLVCNLFTNGTGINHKNVNILKENARYIGVSLEGLRFENDLVRGKGSWAKTIRAIKLLKKKHIPFGIYLTLNKTNIDNLKNILCEFKRLGPENISVNELVLRARARNAKSQLYVNIDREMILKTVKAVFPDERFRVERGCNINPKNIFLTSDGKFYLCTEIRQCSKNRYCGSFILPKFHKFTKFSERFSKDSLPKKCPYISYVSKKITLNFLTGEKCDFVK